MDGHRSTAALARIEAALARIDAARTQLTGSAPQPHPAEAALSALQDEVADVVQQLETLMRQAETSRG